MTAPSFPDGIDKAALLDRLNALNEVGQEPTLAGVDAEGINFLAYLAEPVGDDVHAGVVIDEPHQTVYGLTQDRVCDECGCPGRRWSLDDLKYPVQLTVDLLRRFTAITTEATMTTSETNPFPDGIDGITLDPEVWEEVTLGEWRTYRLEDKFKIGVTGLNQHYRYFIRRDPTPTMPPLPSEPGTAIRAWFGTNPHGSVIALGDDGWRFATTGGVLHHTVKHIVRWQLLTTHADAAKAFGVDELREAYNNGSRWQDVVAAVENVLACVDREVQR